MTIATHFIGDFWINLCEGVLWVSTHAPKLRRVGVVASWCCPFQIFDTVIRSVSVNMVNHFSFLGRTNKGTRHETVHGCRDDGPLISELNVVVSFDLGEGNKSGRESDPTTIADFVNIFPKLKWDWLPHFIVAHDNTPMFIPGR